MQNKRINTVLLLLPLLLISCRPSLDRKFSELDRELKRADAYMSDFRYRADSLEGELRLDAPGSVKWGICYELFSSFLHISLDSANVYCADLERYAVNDDLRMRTAACRLNCLRLSGDIEKMGEVQGLDASKVAPEFRSDWYFLLQRAYDKVYDSLAVHYMNEAIASEDVDPAMKARMRGLICIRARDNEGTVRQFHEVYGLSESCHMKGAEHHILFCRIAFHPSACTRSQQDRRTFFHIYLSPRRRFGTAFRSMPLRTPLIYS